jgi:hypothetical protein
MVERKTVNERLEELTNAGISVRQEKHRAPGSGEFIAFYEDGREVVNTSSHTYDVRTSDVFAHKIVTLTRIAGEEPNVNQGVLDADIAENRIVSEHRFIYGTDGIMWTFDVPSRKYLKQ